MAVYKADILDIELNTGNIARSFLCHNIGKDDTKADRFGVRVYRDGEAVSLSGCSIQGYMMRPNGTNLAITGSDTGVSGNEAWVDLPQAAYDYEGQFCLALKLIGGGVTGTVRIKFYKGTCTVVGRKSDYSVYDYALATYDKGDTFNHESSAGFIELFALPAKTWAQNRQLNADK